jgi:6-phosphogluconate dehydrogenase
MNRTESEFCRGSGRMLDSGEGRWTALCAIDESVRAPIISETLFERFSSRGDADYAESVWPA